MVPKKTITKRSWPGLKPSSKEKRSKYTEDALTHRGESFEEPRTSPLIARKAPSMAMWQVVSGRHILFKFLEELGLELGDKLEEQGWVYFCSLNTYTYPTLVRTFYKNLIVKEEHIESRVKDKRIILSEELLSSLLQMPHFGNKYLELECKKQC